MSSVLGVEVPVFEIRDVVGDKSDLLVRNPAIGAALARALGDKAVVLMRGHGSVTAGTSIPQVVFRAYYAEMGMPRAGELMDRAAFNSLYRPSGRTTLELRIATSLSPP